jgi:hypothetical protein
MSRPCADLYERLGWWRALVAGVITPAVHAAVGAERAGVPKSDAQPHENSLGWLVDAASVVAPANDASICSEGAIRVDAATDGREMTVGWSTRAETPADT